MNGKILLGILASAVLLLVACDQRSPYQKMVDEGLSSGERYDSTLLGIQFGMTVKEFFDYCFEMNQKGSFQQGSGTVIYDVNDKLPLPAQMEFYPIFQDTQIVELPIAVTYDNWAPWNKRAFADSLQLDLKNLLEEWHGEGFVEVTHPERGSIFVKVDGNRRIIIAKQDDQIAKVLYTDMSVQQKEDVSQEFGNAYGAPMETSE